MSRMSEVTQERRRLQFSLQTIFAAMFVVAVILVVARLIPLYVSILFAGAMPAPALTALAVRYRGLRRSTMVASLVFAWLLFYAVSIGPIAAMGMWLGLESQPLCQAFFRSFYAPVLYLYQLPSLAWYLEWYTDSWHHVGMLLR